MRNSGHIDDEDEGGVATNDGKKGRVEGVKWNGEQGVKYEWETRERTKKS